MGKRASWILLGLIVTLGAGVRFYRLSEKSLWSDEIATIATGLGNRIDPDGFTLRGEAFDPPVPVPASVYKARATRSHGQDRAVQTVAVLKANVHPPLFFWLMGQWMAHFGFEPGILRVPAAIFGVLTIPALYGLALQLIAWPGSGFSPGQQRAFALVAAACLAFSAYQVDHAQDARPYTLVLLLAILSAGLALRLARKPAQAAWSLWLALALALSAGLYTQYFFFVFASGLLALLAWTGRRNSRFLIGLASVVALMLLLFLPWLEIFREQMAFFKQAGHYTAGLWKPLHLPEKLWRIVCEFFLPDSPLGKLIPPLLLLLGLGAGWWGQSLAKAEDPPEMARSGSFSPALGVMLAWLLWIIGGQIGLDLLKHTHTATIRRYLLLASPACYLLMAYTLMTLGRWRIGRMRCWLPAAFSLLLLGLMLGDTRYRLLAAHTSSDEFRQAASLINASGQPGDRVLVSRSGAMAVGMAYYLKPQTLMLGLDVPNYAALNDGTRLIRRVQEAVRDVQQAGSGRVWLVLSHAAPSTGKRLSALLAAEGFVKRAQRKVPGLRLLLFEAKK